jgi:uncharacterized protein YraI
MFRLSIVLSAALAAGALIAPAADAAVGWANAAAKLRACASEDCPVLKIIPEGARVRAYTCGGWCEVRYGGWRGYVSARYISFEGDRPPAPPRQMIIPLHPRP